jgi:hypothetical protein
MPVRRIKRISQFKDTQAGQAIAGKKRLFTEILPKRKPFCFGIINMLFFATAIWLI